MTASTKVPSPSNAETRLQISVENTGAPVGSYSTRDLQTVLDELRAYRVASRLYFGLWQSAEADVRRVKAAWQSARRRAAK